MWPDIKTTYRPKNPTEREGGRQTVTEIQNKKHKAWWECLESKQPRNLNTEKEFIEQRKQLNMDDS